MVRPIPFACACEAGLWRTVLGTEQLQNSGQRVVACMRCGRAGAVVAKMEPIEGDPRDGSRVVGLDVLAIEEPDLAWLGAWPRRVGDPEHFHVHHDSVFFLPPTARFETELDLERAEARARDGAPARYDERLRAAGVPAEAPPDSKLVRQRFWFFAETWEALARPDDASVEALLERADPMRRPASWVAEPKLPRGDELARAIAALVGDADAGRRRKGLSALNVLKLRSAATPGVFTLPEVIVEAARARVAALEPADRSFLIAVLGAHDPRAAERLR